MRRLPAVAGVIALMACARAETPQADTAAAAPPPPPALSFAQVAGTWTVVSRAETSDSVMATAELVATADGSDWTQTLPNRPPTPMRVRIDGDSIMTEAGPFQSILRPKLQVITTGVMRLVDGKLVGITTAHYQGAAGADSVVRLRSEGTRKQ